MIDAGLLGVEIAHRDNSASGREFLASLARKHGLIVTGSSDYHGAGKENRLGENTTASEVLAEIEARASGVVPVLR